MEKKKKKKGKEKASRQPSRPPIVVVLGHIDHGKTTLLDSIRQSNTAAKEEGGITQKIGAHQIEIKEEKGKRVLTFIDTPGHEAFAKMRGRGAHVADVAVLVVAADDGVMPQTKEALAHAQTAGIPIVVAINKSDLKGANPDRVKKQLAKEGLVVEGQGGDVPSVVVSAKNGKGIVELLEMIGLVADLKGVKGDPTAPLSATIIESLLSPRRGPLATLVIEEGTLRVGDQIFAGEVSGKVKALFDEKGKRVKEAPPGFPVEVLGFAEVPPVGEAVEGAKGTRGPVKKEADFDKGASLPSESASQDLNVVLRADTQGSLEAVAAALAKVKVGERGVHCLLSGVGQIVDSDIYLAQSGKGIAIGFNVGASSSSKRLAADLGVGLRSFTIIYDLLETVEKILKGVEETERAEIKGEGEVLKRFSLHSGDVVIGVRVLVGKIKYRDKIKITRVVEGEEEELQQGRVRGLKLGKEDIQQAKEGDEVGVLLKPQYDAKKGDKITVV
jgi:translation initiation factor IF-2